MLLLERQGQPYNKTERRRALQALLNGRSERAIEDKHQNISAILIEFGHPYISGYKPLFNYQTLLRTVVESQIAGKPELPAAIEAELARPMPVPSVDHILDRLVKPPDPQPRRVREKAPHYGRPNRDYIALEARNSALGRAGELFAVNFEKARLIRGGQEQLVDSVEHVSITRGDAAGYDIRSFDPGGRERLIEVKTTGYGLYTPFFVSPNELEVSERTAEAYHIYRIYGFRQDPHLFMLRGSMSRTLVLEASQFKAFVG
jgi:hypothetical protein